MRAIVLRQPGGLNKLEATSMPDVGAPAPGEIAVQIKASSLNYHDYAVVTGAIKAPDQRIPMSDAAGEVTAVGDGVIGYKIGDRVVSTFFPDWLDGKPGEGGFSRVPGDGIDGYAREAVVAPSTAFTRAPKGYSHSEAATLTCAGLTAWRALAHEGQLKAGETVLVQGTGGVSIFALQFAKSMGATVVATSSSDAKLERLKALGADHLINYKSVEKWGNMAREMSGGGLDHIVEIGGAGTLPQSIAAAKIGGHIALIGILAGLHGPIPTAALMTKQIRLQGITVGSRRQQLSMVKAIDATGIRPVIDQTFPLEGLADAFRYQESGKHFGKICIDVTS
ncbi:NAD(P)-dependent alcohol dehydrogenase [Bradyrhizobium tropiciagri]|uniref:zinc-dependent alcohol dehydrogenase family protein n=1 Tax=Bradyrhizobium tropiciagri TaxID=312253 RepID=UPI001BA4BB23|nr:NAD(P)-dependent alcohol dehydrogenase [Bradyrhizobium tropiciagri]MBR0898939.1 NAD(P)-dependent alcohol dehydrogenase [Bradyrhizobium tropiciagri]